MNKKNNNDKKFHNFSFVAPTRIELASKVYETPILYIELQGHIKQNYISLVKKIINKQYNL